MLCSCVKIVDIENIVELSFLNWHLEPKYSFLHVHVTLFEYDEHDPSFKQGDIRHPLN